MDSKKLLHTIFDQSKKIEFNFFSKDASIKWLESILDLLFPMAFTANVITVNKIDELQWELEIFLGKSQIVKSHLITEMFFQDIPRLHKMLLLDVEALFAGDPAATSRQEVVLTYPGFLAITVHRIAHYFYQHKAYLLSRIFAEWAHEKTGIDIHPGARIGESFCIDHGTGVVIGETATIGNNVKIYQGVTLGALSVSKSKSGIKRHPTIEDNVVIYSNATILGGDTRIGARSIIGGNVWITESVPPDSTVIRKAEVQMKTNVSSYAYN